MNGSRGGGGKDVLVTKRITFENEFLHFHDSYQASRSKGAIDIEQADGVGMLSVGEVGGSSSVGHCGFEL